MFLLNADFDEDSIVWPMAALLDRRRNKIPSVVITVPEAVEADIDPTSTNDLVDDDEDDANAIPDVRMVIVTILFFYINLTKWIYMIIQSTFG